MCSLLSPTWAALLCTKCQKQLRDRVLKWRAGTCALVRTPAILSAFQRGIFQVTFALLKCEGLDFLVSFGGLRWSHYWTLWSDSGYGGPACISWPEKPQVDLCPSQDIKGPADRTIHRALPLILEFFLLPQHLLSRCPCVAFFFFFKLEDCNQTLGVCVLILTA